MIHKSWLSIAYVKEQLKKKSSIDICINREIDYIKEERGYLFSCCPMCIETNHNCKMCIFNRYFDRMEKSSVPCETLLNLASTGKERPYRNYDHEFIYGFLRFMKEDYRTEQVPRLAIMDK